MINKRGEIMLIDSHKHSYTDGAIVVTSPQDKLKDMIKYIKETMSEGKEFEETRVKLQVTSEQELSEQVEQQLSEQVLNIHARTDRSLEIIIC
jgi:2C-methyl-D-erythritol 2,4-cyclodiphosphate synthase